MMGPMVKSNTNNGNEMNIANLEITKEVASLICQAARQDGRIDFSDGPAAWTVLTMGGRKGYRVIGGDRVVVRKNVDRVRAHLLAHR